MAVREIVTIGDPVLRERAREVTPEELRSPEVQGLIDDLIETKRAANGAGLAANQVGETLRVAVAEVDGHQSAIPVQAADPADGHGQSGDRAGGRRDVRGQRGLPVGPRSARLPGAPGDGFESATSTATATSTTRSGRGLTPGTFQHEVDHLDGVLFVDRADPRTLSTWEQYERHQRAEFEARARAIVERYGS